MKALAVIPGRPNSMHLRDVPVPTIRDVPDGRGVLVKVLRIGVDGTDKEINAAEYGAAPKGHELDNLYVVDASFFPSSGAVNPALTIMANALRVGEHLTERLNRATPVLA